MSELIAFNTLATSAQYQQHTHFWTTLWKSIAADFSLQQNWRSYALPYGPSPQVSFDIEGRAAEVLAKLSQGNNLNTLVVIMGALAHVLRKYGDAKRFFVDTPRLAGTSEAYVDCIPVVLGPPAGTVREYLNRYRESVQESYTYQDFPAVDFAGKLADRTPRTNVYVRFEELHEQVAPAAHHDLAIVIRRKGNIRISMHGNERVFTHHYLEHLGRHLRNVITAMDQLDSPLQGISLLDAQEKRTLRATGERLPVQETVLDHLASRMRDFAQSVAVVTDIATLTYADLEERSNSLAAFLQAEYGIERGDPVGLIGDRSERWIIGILAILKAGAVYVPLDPDIPQESVSSIIEDAGVRVLLMQSQFLHLLTQAAGIPMFALDLQLEGVEPASAALPRVEPDDAAYIIYTSGFTGAPKGITLNHRGLSNMAQWHVEAFGFAAADRVAQLYPAAFDGSIMEIFVTLLAGACLVLLPPEVCGDSARLTAALQAQEVTTLNALPTQISALDWSVLPTVRRIISAGDNAQVNVAVELARTRTFHNSYGPAETTVCVTDYVVDPRVNYGERIPVGKPIRNADIYLLDAEQQCAPQGCIGEICIAGPMLARGYLHRDDLTNAAFIAHPFQAGERLYRTGDLGVWLPDGNLEFIGRRDSQVKLQGRRVELLEIETALLRYPAVEQAVVLLHDAAQGPAQLMAYVTPSNLNTTDVREHLRGLLAQFMVTASVQCLERLPLDTDGNIDRKALRERPWRQECERPSVTAPRGELELRLGKIWAELLGLDNIGVDRDLFELGADSILVLQAVSRAQQAGIRVTAQAHFAHPTLAALAAVATQSSPARASREFVSGRAVLSPIQRWFFEQPLESPQHYNQSQLMEVPATLEPSILEAALGILLEHHDALRLSFFRAEDGWEALHEAPPLSTRVGSTSLQNMAPAEQCTLFESVATGLQSSLELSRPPLLRAHLFRYGANRPSRLLLIAHHLVIDAVSWGIVLQDLYSVCGQLEAGQTVRLPDKTSSFRDWTQRLQSLAASNFPDRDYWETQAARIQPSFAGSSPGTVESADNVVLRFDESLTRTILQDNKRARGVQINDLLLTALWLAFRDWRGLTELCVELEGHGREELFDDLDVSRTVGWFTTHYPVLLSAAPSATPAAALRGIAERLRGVPTRGLGYGLVRTANHSTAPVRFNYLGQMDRVLPAEVTWKPLLESPGREHGPRTPRAHLFEVDGMIFQGRLQLTWTYNRNAHDRGAIEQLTGLYTGHLEQLVHSQSTVDRSLTPEDFPAARIDKTALAALLARLQR